MLTKVSEIQAEFRSEAVRAGWTCVTRPPVLSRLLSGPSWIRGLISALVPCIQWQCLHSTSCCLPLDYSEYLTTRTLWTWASHCLCHQQCGEQSSHIPGKMQQSVNHFQHATGWVCAWRNLGHGGWCEGCLDLTLTCPHCCSSRAVSEKRSSYRKTESRQKGSFPITTLAIFDTLQSED